MPPMAYNKLNPQFPAPIPLQQVARGPGRRKTISRTSQDDGEEEDYDEDDDEDAGLGSKSKASVVPDVKKKSRGSRACTVCRKLKMRCVGAESGPPCKRCEDTKQECIFEESMRGKRSSKKTEAMAQSLNKVERTLDALMLSISQQQPSLLTTVIPELTVKTEPSINYSISPASVLPNTPVVPTPHLHQNHSVRFDTEDIRSVSDNSNHKSPASVAASASMGSGISAIREPTSAISETTLNPLGLLAEASLQNHNLRKRGAPGQSSDAEEEQSRKKGKLGIANAGYFSPFSPTALHTRRNGEPATPPLLLTEKILAPEEVVDLFTIYFEKCHYPFPILDAELYTPMGCCSRSPFLFTCICTIASKFYTKRTDNLHRRSMKICQEMAFDAITKNYKSTEIVQGFLLLCQWYQPTERFDEERTFQFSGIAIRMATELNLHKKSTYTIPADASDAARISFIREVRNKERTWMSIFINDRSISNQMGKPYSIPREDLIVRNAATWWREPLNLPTDSGFCAMVVMHRIVTRMIDTVHSDVTSLNGLNQNVDYNVVLSSFLQQLDQWNADWNLTPNSTDIRDMMRGHMRVFYVSYYRLFLLSFALQQSLDTNQELELPRLCSLCFEAARRIITTAHDHLAPSGYLRYSIDSTFVFLSYACCFLLKLANRTFNNAVESEQAFRLVEQGAAALSSSAVDETHTPALYATFLRALLESRRGNRTLPSSRAGTRPPSPSHGLRLDDLHSDSAPFLRSRQASMNARDAAQGIMNGLGSNGEQLSMHLMDLSQAERYDGQAMDDLLQNSGFWENMLMPGFGGPMQGLSGGSGTIHDTRDLWTTTPFHSRPGTPSQLSGFLDL